MHTTEGEKFRFHHNGDFSGDVVIVNNETDEHIRVPMSDLLSLVAKYVRQRRIEELESASDEEILMRQRTEGSPK